MRRLAILMFCVFSITTGEFVIAGILPEVADSLEITVGTAGLLITAYAVGMIIGGPVLTALTSAMHRKRLMVVLLGVAVVSNLLSALAPGFALLLAARVGAALVTSTFFAQAIVVVVRSAPPERAGVSVARLAFGMNLAMIAGAPLGTLIAGQWGWRATFVAIAIACLIGLILVLFGLEAPPEAARSSALGELRTLRRKPVVLALTTTAVGNAGALMVFSYLAPLFGEAGHPAEQLPVLLLIYGLGALLGNLFGGALYDRRPRLFQPLLLGALALALAGCWFIATAAVATTVAAFVLGALSFAVIPGMQARVMQTAAEAPTLAMAVNASGYQLAAAGAGLVGGIIVDSFDPRSIYLVAAGLTVIGLLLTVSRKRANPKRA